MITTIVVPHDIILMFIR